MAFLLRFELPISPEDWRQLLITLPLILGLRLLAFDRFHLYEELWRYVSMRDILAILSAVTLSSLVFSFAVLGLINADFPWTIFPIDWGVCLLFVGGARLALRALREWRMRSSGRTGRRALIIGAGDAGELLIREIGRNPSLNYHIVGFVDDETGKHGKRIHGVEVLGSIDQLPVFCSSYQVQELLIAIPSATGSEMRRIIEGCRAAKVEFRTMPSLGELKEGPFSLSKVRRVNIDDLLRREPVKIDDAEVDRLVRGKRILVTGAGGSIGSELCRQIARFSPGKLVLLDRAENSLFFVDMELQKTCPQVDLQPVIGDVTDESRMKIVFQEHKPQIVFHAAAHKHVPLMEANKAEAVKNNVRGTMMVANAAWHYGVEVFVMISTDKAVRPSSVMGATKRLAEMYVQSLNSRIETRFMTVRFGNVLGSEGSVLQVFQRQIEAGGPVTITHPDMKWYFMTIPEASQLVLQAATLGRGGEIFVLDMGEPVRIVDLAEDLITLSGLEPGKDIAVTFIGPRPGEKLFEELLGSETRIAPTSHEKIMIVETDPADFEALQVGISELLRNAEAEDEPTLLARLTSLVPGYVNGHTPIGTFRDKPERILLVDHDPYSRTTLKRILENQYQVCEAEDRRQTLFLMRDWQPKLVILNLHLPATNIRRLCARIKGGTGNPAVILLAESADAASLNDVFALGGDDRLYKPIPVKILESRVRMLLKREEALQGARADSEKRGNGGS